MILTEVKIEGRGVPHRGCDVTSFCFFFFFFGGTTPEFVLSRPVRDYFPFHCLCCQGCSCSAVRYLDKSVRSRAPAPRRPDLTQLCQQRISSRGLESRACFYSFPRVSLRFSISWNEETYESYSHGIMNLKIEISNAKKT